MTISKPDQAEAAPRPTRRRGEALLHAIYEASILETAALGLSGLTMEGIARRAGTAKTSLYRRWSTPEDILIEAMHRNFPQEEPSPAATDLRSDLIAALMLLRETSASPMGQALFAVVAEAGRYPHLHKRIWRDVFDARGGRFTKTVLHHYARAGRLDPARITPVVEDIGEALFIKFVVDNGLPPDRAHIEAIVEQAILPALGRG